MAYTNGEGIRWRPMTAALMLCCMALCAVPYSIMGMLTPEIMAAYAIGAGEVSRMSFYLNFGGILALLLGMLFSDRLAKRWTVFGLGAVMALSLILIAFCDAYAGLLCMIFFFGICSNQINAEISAYMGDLYPEQRTRFVNLVAAFYSGGAVLGPFYATWMTQRGVRFQQTFSYPGVLIAVLMLLYLIPCLCSGKTNQTPRRAAEQGQTGASDIWKNLLATLRTPSIIRIALVSFLCSVTQNGFGFWFPTYLSGRGVFTETTTSLAMTLYWCMELVGRLLFALLAGKLRPGRYVVIGSIISTAAVCCAIAAGSPPVLFAGVIVLGLADSAIYPVTISLACEQKQALAGTAASIVCLMASAGALLIGRAVGIAADHIGIGAAIWLIVIGCALNALFGRRWLPEGKAIGQSGPVAQ